jgi:hypothetical protein
VLFPLRTRHYSDAEVDALVRAAGAPRCSDERGRASDIELAGAVEGVER